LAELVPKGKFSLLERCSKEMTITRQDREKAVKRTLANSALEGLRPNPQFIALLGRYIAGEISLANALEYTKAQYTALHLR
jgi:hypothetical protein